MDDEPPSHRCRNCDLRCVGELCSVCNSRRHCQYRLRRLPDHSFDNADVNVCLVNLNYFYFPHDQLRAASLTGRHLVGKNSHAAILLAFRTLPLIIIIVYNRTGKALFFYLQACAKRNERRRLFFRRTALNGAAVETQFDCTQENDTYENLFDHLRDPILSTVQHQIDLDGYVINSY